MSAGTGRSYCTWCARAWRHASTRRPSACRWCGGHGSCAPAWGWGSQAWVGYWSPARCTGVTGGVLCERCFWGGSLSSFARIIWLLQEPHRVRFSCGSPSLSLCSDLLTGFYPSNATRSCEEMAPLLHVSDRSCTCKHSRKPNRSSAGLSIQIKLKAAGSERKQITVLGLCLCRKLFIMF